MGASYGKRKDSKRNKIAGRFAAIPHSVINSEEFMALSHTACRLLITLMAQFNGSNNGKLVCCSGYLKQYGWNSNDTITRAKRQLLDSGLLIQTRQGMMPPCSRPGWFAIGWLALDEIDGLDFDHRVYRKCQLTQIKIKRI